MVLMIWVLNNFNKVKSWYFKNKFYINLVVIFVLIYVIFIYFDFMNYNYKLWVLKWENIIPPNNITGSFPIFNYSVIQ